MDAPLSSWPWENFGVFKYVFYGPIVGKVLYEMMNQEEDSKLNLSWWCLNLIILCVLRISLHVLWSSYSNMLFLTRDRKILQQGVDFNQIDKEWNWDNFIILQTLVAFIVCYIFPFLQHLPIWNVKGLIVALILHVGVSEPLYYWFHKKFHGDYLFKNYHSLHHSSLVPTPLTAGNATFMEHIILMMVIGIPIFGTSMMGYGSTSLVYGYVLIFDYLRCLGHCNVEIVPHKWFEAFPFLKYVLYTPT